MRFLLVVLAVLAGGCIGGSNPAAGPAPAGPAAAATIAWSNSTVSGAFTGWAVPPAAGGAWPDSAVHRVHVTNATGNATRLLRLTLDETPRGRAEYYVAPPSCTDPEVSECRSEKGFVDREFRIYEAKWPQAGTWRFQVSGSGLGVAEVKYSIKVQTEHVVG